MKKSVFIGHLPSEIIWLCKTPPNASRTFHSLFCVLRQVVCSCQSWNLVVSRLPYLRRTFLAPVFHKDKSTADYITKWYPFLSDVSFQDEFTNISTVSMESSSSNGVSDGQPLWPWSPKRPEKYSIDRAGLPKREELSPGLKLRKACGILLMVAVLFALVIGIYVHFSSKFITILKTGHVLTFYLLYRWTAYLCHYSNRLNWRGNELLYCFFQMVIIKRQSCTKIFARPW